MIFAIDFDGTLVDMDHAYADLEAPLQLLPDAERALHALRRAGHVLVLTSARANRALIDDWRLNPLWRTGAVRFDPAYWEKNRALNEARYKQMVAFVEAELPGVFNAIDDGHQGKVSADYYIDDRAMRFGDGVGAVRWNHLAITFGDLDETEGAW